MVGKDMRVGWQALIPWSEITYIAHIHINTYVCMPTTLPASLLTITTLFLINVIYLFIFIFETGSHYVAKVCLEL
jgi:hypothetical protein